MACVTDMAMVKMMIWIVLSMVPSLHASLHAGCPPDYRSRVQTCIMEAEVAPQAGGGLTLITDRNKLDTLCKQGTLHKSIDCLRDVHNRCSGDAATRQELDSLFSLDDWTQGRDLLCEDLNLFSKHFDCLSQFAPRISACMWMRTQMFKKSVTDAGMATHKTLHDITCNFAENIVHCLERPLSRACPVLVVDTMVTALHRFLPPACAPLPAVINSNGEGEAGRVGDDPILETVILEGGGATD